MGTSVPERQGKAVSGSAVPIRLGNPVAPEEEPKASICCEVRRDSKSTSHQIRWVIALFQPEGSPTETVASIELPRGEYFRFPWFEGKGSLRQPATPCPQIFPSLASIFGLITRQLIVVWVCIITGPIQSLEVAIRKQSVLRTGDIFRPQTLIKVRHWIDDRHCPWQRTSRPKSKKVRMFAATLTCVECSTDFMLQGNIERIP